MGNTASLKIKAQKLSTFLSDMVMPFNGVFIAWGILTALFIESGWMPNKELNHLVDPTLKYLMPILIGYKGGSLIYKERGGAIGALGTIGVVIGADIIMLVGGMVMGPLSAYLLKRVDQFFTGKIKPGLEELIENFSMGIVGALLMILGYQVIEPIFNFILSIFMAGVNYLVNANILPFTAIFVQPAQVLFLNNVINYGIMIPLGAEQVTEFGKSILFLVEANGGVWTGVAIAFTFFGRGMAKRTAPGAAVIMFLGGIAEVVFPYVLAKPKALLGPIIGNVAALFVLIFLKGGAVAAVAPGSFLMLLAMTPKGAFIANIAGYATALLVSFAITAFILKQESTKDEAHDIICQQA